MRTINEIERKKNSALISIENGSQYRFGNTSCTVIYFLERVLLYDNT